MPFEGLPDEFRADVLDGDGLLEGKTRFLRKTAAGRDVYQETLFRVVIGRLDGKPYVLSFGFL